MISMTVSAAPQWGPGSVRPKELGLWEGRKLCKSEKGPKESANDPFRSTMLKPCLSSDFD